MDRNEIVRSGQKLFDQNIKRIEKKRWKHSKYLNDALTNLENLELRCKALKLNLDNISRTRDVVFKCIEEQSQIFEERKVEMIRLRQQKKTLCKKFSIISQQDFNIKEADQERAFKKKLRLTLSKVSTKVYIDENTPSNIIRGFAGDDVEKVLFPFQFDTKTAKDEYREQLWELSKKTSRYITEWEKLFAV